MNKGLLSVDEALEVLLAGARPVQDVEEVPTLEATGRVLARAQSSTMDVPPMDNSAMDGYAVRIADGARLKVAQRIMAGAVGKALEPGTAARIFTGAPIPPGCDAIVMQEHCEAQGEFVLLNKSPQPHEWIRRRASDIAKGAQILAAGIRLRPQDTGLAASVGIKSLPLRRRVRLGLFFTGDELVMPGDPLPPGRIYNSNRFTLNGLAPVSTTVLFIALISCSLAVDLKPATQLCIFKVLRRTTVCQDHLDRCCVVDNCIATGDWWLGTSFCGCILVGLGSGSCLGLSHAVAQYLPFNFQFFPQRQFSLS